MNYSVKQMAELFNVTEHTVRYYTDIGLLPCERDRNNRRVFTETSVNWLQGIICLRGCGFSMEEISRYCELCRKEENEENLRLRYEMIADAENRAEIAVKEAKKVLDYTKKKVLHYEEILSGEKPDDSNPEKWTEKTRPEKH